MPVRKCGPQRRELHRAAGVTNALSPAWRGRVACLGTGPENAGYEHFERRYEIPQELLGRLIGNFARLGDQARSELDVGFRRPHLWRITVAQHTAQALLSDSGSDLAYGGADHRRRLVRERVRSVRAAGPIDSVLQTAGDASVVLGRHEQHRIHRGDRILERAALRRVIRVEIAVVQWEIPYRDLHEVQIFRRQPDERRR